jgi:(R,R)-butanediol dehydrogenase / meso-butanediol dehydrogenase / diacetyl reductase
VKAAVFRAPGDVRIESVPEPGLPGPGELLIRVSKAALCGTDSAEWAHGPLLARPPVVLGHEFTGEVVAAGSDVSGFTAGTRVVSGAGISCGRCAWCAAGRTNLCASYQTLGLHLDGGLAEFVTSPAVICRTVPDALDDTGAAMAQPLRRHWARTAWSPSTSMTAGSPPRRPSARPPRCTGAAGTRPSWRGPPSAVTAPTS